MARRFRLVGDILEVDDLILAGVKAILEALRSRPDAPATYLYGAGRRAILDDVRRMIWNKQRAPSLTIPEVGLVFLEEHEPLGGDERMEASAQLALIQRKARRFDWEVGLKTWLEEYTLREAAEVFQRCPAVLCDRRARLSA